MSGQVSMADLGGWDCILVNGLTAILGASLNGGADWTFLSDIEPYLAADSVTRQFANAALRPCCGSPLDHPITVWGPVICLHIVPRQELRGRAGLSSLA